MCELWSLLFLFVRIVTKIKELSEDDSWWFHLISVAPFFDHIWKAGPHLICTTAPPLVIILCLIRLSWSSESWFKDFFFWGTSALFLIYDRYIWKGRIIFPSFLFSTTVNFLEDAHLQGWLWVFVKGYHLKVGYIEKSLEAVHCTITFCILQSFVVVDILRVGWTDSRCRLVWTSIYIEKMIVLEYVFYKLLLDQINFNIKGIILLKSVLTALDMTRIKRPRKSCLTS